MRGEAVATIFEHLIRIDTANVTLSWHKPDDVYEPGDFIPTLTLTLQPYLPPKEPEQL